MEWILSKIIKSLNVKSVVLKCKFLLQNSNDRNAFQYTHKTHCCLFAYAYNMTKQFKFKFCLYWLWIWHWRFFSNKMVIKENLNLKKINIYALYVYLYTSNCTIIKGVRLPWHFVFKDKMLNVRNNNYVLRKLITWSMS